MAKKSEEVVTTISPQEQFESFLKNNEGYHYNNMEEYSYTVSSGSLSLDIKMSGGLRPGIVRFSGTTEGGKTSCALSFAREFQKTVKNGYVIYVKAEGRLSEEMLARSGVDTSPSKFKVFKTNVYEGVISMIENQIKNNPTNSRYFFVIDSMDSLNTVEDLNKVIAPPKKKEEGKDDEKSSHARPMGGAVLSSIFLKRMALPLTEMGHICVMISQVRSDVKIGYTSTKGTNSNVITSSGGNALLHYSDWILEFQKRNNDDLIKDKEEIIGHFCKIIFKKSPNEKSQSEVRYPIKYGRTGGKSVWIEKEVADLLVTYSYVEKKGAWFRFNTAMIKKVKTELDIVLPEAFQGFPAFGDYLEQNPKVSEFFYKELRSGLSELE